MSLISTLSSCWQVASGVRSVTGVSAAAKRLSPLSLCTPSSEEIPLRLISSCVTPSGSCGSCCHAAMPLISSDRSLGKPVRSRLSACASVRVQPGSPNSHTVAEVRPVRSSPVKAHFSMVRIPSFFSPAMVLRSSGVSCTSFRRRLVIPASYLVPAMVTLLPSRSRAIASTAASSTPTGIIHFFLPDFLSALSFGTLAVFFSFAAGAGVFAGSFFPSAGGSALSQPNSVRISRSIRCIAASRPS